MFDKLTREDIQKMEQEIEHRKLVVRKETIEAVKEARAHGDLSENFEYYAAKKEKNRNESRIRYLERMIRTAVILEDHAAADEAGINKTVTLFIEDDEEEEVFHLVTTVRGNSLNNYISNESPIGKAVMGHKAGDRVYVQVNDKFGYYVVIRDVKPTEGGDDSIRGF